MGHTSIDTVGILLPEFPPLPKRYSLEEFMRTTMESDDVSKWARNLLTSASPSRCRHDGNQKRLIMVEGKYLPLDPHSEEIRRFACVQGWGTPSMEDVLRIFPALTSRSFPLGVVSVVALHKLVKDQVLGFSVEKNRLVLSAHKADPREGWFCRKGAFIFRSE